MDKRTAKRAKKAEITFEEVKCIKFICEYKCPECKTTFRGDLGINRSTIRFRCTCGQELVCT